MFVNDEDIPLHATVRNPGRMIILKDDPASPLWWACDEPERPSDLRMGLDNRCPKCRIKGEVELRRGNNYQMYDHDGRWVTLAEWLTNVKV